jgi:AcrR family transcriptional regulator
MAKLDNRNATEQSFLDAAERLLVEVGYGNITTRRLAEEAGANLGLVHYYFGSMEQLFIRVLERFTDRLIERQRAMYAAPIPFREKWRAAMGYLDEDRESGYQKIWLELQALAWNRPELRERLAHVHHQWITALTEAFGLAMEEYGLDTERFPVAAMVALVATFNEGIILDRLGSMTEGHAELLAMIDNWLVALEERKNEKNEKNEGTGDDHASAHS